MAEAVKRVFATEEAKAADANKAEPAAEASASDAPAPERLVVDCRGSIGAVALVARRRRGRRGLRQRKKKRP